MNSLAFIHHRHFPIPRACCLSAVGIFALALSLAAPLFAIDPLPAEIEKAPLEAQKIYRERLAREGLEEKTAVGKRRHDERMRFQEKLIQGIRHEATVREEAIYSQIDPQAALADTAIPSPADFFGKLPLLCVLGVFGYLVSSRVIKGLWNGSASRSLMRH
ncbi:MAG: hypothetical protein HY043_04020 [Verrucomicrobia bacterium]|nr:hypothetical protein [Verrucomicrobiota bacterium]